MILDVCCGPKHMWFNKSHPHVIYGDKRQESHTVVGPKWGKRTFHIAPDVLYDFTALPFRDESFDLVVFDPPHLKSFTETSFMAKKYGALFAGWEEMIKAGFEECFRVMKQSATLIFKWNETEIPLARVLSLCEQQPLFGHTTNVKMNTHWMTFMKE